tara:strand:+ start:1020 stop:2468 length:1449 start_codon:yes stop_codon:yes gene_type:complete
MARPRERNGDAGRDRARGEVTGHGWKVDFVFSQKIIFKKKTTTLAWVSLSLANSSAPSPPTMLRRKLKSKPSRDPIALAPSLSGLSEELVEHIASFLAPPDVYSFLAAIETSSSFSQPLAARLMQPVQSELWRQLDANLKDVISRKKEDRPLFTLDDLFPEDDREEDFDEEGRPQVLLSGSCAVQAALGRVFEDPDGEVDNDIFCTWHAAPLVRQRLVERCGLICAGVDNKTYKHQFDERDHVGDHKFSTVDHVEWYAGRPTDGESRIGPGEYVPYSSDEYYQEALECGKETVDYCEVRGNTVYRKWVGLPGGSAGGNFPYDFDLRACAFVQLIIGNEDTEDARALLNSFDLEICKCHFDGRDFFVPNPKDTFAGRTAMTASRRAMVEKFCERIAAFDNETQEENPSDDPDSPEGEWKIGTHVGWNNTAPACSSVACRSTRNAESKSSTRHHWRLIGMSNGRTEDGNAGSGKRDVLYHTLLE